ncbi:hypothetical protein PMAYCL1PPCAC_21583, partial [Pristionchus mayeri]
LRVGARARQRNVQVRSHGRLALRDLLGQGDAAASEDEGAVDLSQRPCGDDLATLDDEDVVARVLKLVGVGCELLHATRLPNVVVELVVLVQVVPELVVHVLRRDLHLA